jgi:hypothetical protein
MSAEPLGKAVERQFEQPLDAVSCYSDLTQTVVTDHEVILQFYEAIPGPPQPPHGEPNAVRMRLRATIVLNKTHAEKLARNLTQAASSEPKA